MRRHNLNKQAWATPSRGSLRHQLTRRGYGNERRPPGTEQVPSGRNRVGALMNILLSMCLGFIVLTLALLVFWVLSQFNPLS
jgi:hypothetical protein